VLNRFDIAVTNKYSDEYIEYVYEESLLEFDALVLEKQTLLNSISTIVDLGNFYLYEISEITNFSFVYDEISMYKNEILKMMASDLAYKTTQASVESIAEMNLLYQQYEALILNLTDLEVYEDYGMVLYYEYLNLLEAAYVIDLEKIAFSIYRESIASKIYLFMAYLSETFADELEREQYLLLVDNWINNIRLQSTKEDVLLSYNQAITEITSFVYMQNIPMGHVYFCSDDFIGLMINNSYLSADSMAYETYVLDISQNLYNYIDLNLWILEMINLYDLSQSYLLSEMILSETPEITAYVNDLYTMISDDDVLTLQTEYDKLMILLPEATTTFCFQQLVDVFNTNAANIPFDEWKLAKIDANSIVEGEYNYLILTASNESELLLTEDLNDFYLALTSIIENDFTSLKSLRDLTLSNFALDYEPAPEFAELVSLRIEYLQLWEEFYLVGIPYLDTYYQSIDALENIYLWYRQEIKYASTEIDITNLYLNGVHELIYLPVVYLRFDMYIDSLIAQETAYVNNWYGQHPIYDTQVFIYLDLFIEDIYSSATPYYAYDVYLYYKDTIDQIILYEMQYDYQNILREDYLDYQLILDSSYLSELGDIYNYYYNLLDIEIIWSNFQIHIDNFHLEVNALLPTQWELDLEEATFTINHEYDYRMLTASIASQPLLTEDLDEFNLALLNLEIDDYEGLQLLIDNTINNFTLDYETNPQYLDLYQAKLEYLQKWEEFYLVGIPYVNTEFSSLAELDDLYLNYRQSLRLMTTISGLESVYNQGVSAFSNLMFDYISITPLINEFLTSINSYVDAWELEYSLTSTSVDSLVNNFTVNIYGYPSPYAAYAYYLECREQIDIQILAYMVYHYQSLLDIAYNDYYVTIDPIYHMDLESIYYSHYDILETETVWANFQVIIDNFHIEVAALVNP
ncbi:MAG TPA: hypothetical protein PK160_01345, partial [Bacillota bacterium]|nr:hypothetical protein [Bacillota bacterium]